MWRPSWTQITFSPEKWIVKLVLFHVPNLLSISDCWEEPDRTCDYHHRPLHHTMVSTIETDKINPAMEKNTVESYTWEKLWNVQEHEMGFLECSHTFC